MFPRSFLLLAVCVAVTLLLQTGGGHATPAPYFLVYNTRACNMTLVNTIQLPAVNVTCENYSPYSIGGTITGRYTLMCYPNNTALFYIFGGANSDCNTSTSTDYYVSNASGNECSPVYEHTYNNGVPIVRNDYFYRIFCNAAVSSPTASSLLPLLVSASALIFSLFF